MKCFFDGGFLDTGVYLLSDLAAGHLIEGPAIIIDQNRYSYYSVLLTHYHFFPASILLLFKYMKLIDVTTYSVWTIIFIWGTIVMIYDC